MSEEKENKRWVIKGNIKRLGTDDQVIRRWTNCDSININRQCKDNQRRSDESKSNEDQHQLENVHK